MFGTTLANWIVIKQTCEQRLMHGVLTLLIKIIELIKKNVFQG